jgi:hypothetical protein
MFAALVEFEFFQVIHVKAVDDGVLVLEDHGVFVQMQRRMHVLVFYSLVRAHAEVWYRISAPQDLSPIVAYLP